MIKLAVMKKRLKNAVKHYYWLLDQVDCGEELALQILDSVFVARKNMELLHQICSKLDKTCPPIEYKTI